MSTSVGARSSTVVPAASLVMTFRIVAMAVFGVCWLTALPLELVLHRRVGKRYQNTLAFLIAQLLAGFLATTAVLMASPAARTSANHASCEVSGAVFGITVSFIPFTVLSNAAVIAFCAHYWSNRRRFGTSEQLHSFDSGIPTLVFPPFVRRFLRMDDSWSSGLGSPQRAGSQETAAYPVTGFLQNIRAHLDYHRAMLSRGHAPYGPFTWLTVSTLEPALLVTVGLALFMLTNILAAFGVYLVIVGAAMFIKGRIQAEYWKEWAYDRCDAKLMMAAEQNWEQGKPTTELSHSFTVPVMRAVIPPARHTHADSVVASSEVDRGIGAGGIYTNPSVDANDAPLHGMSGNQQSHVA